MLERQKICYNLIFKKVNLHYMKNLTAREKKDLDSYVFTSLYNDKKESFFGTFLMKFKTFLVRILRK